MTTQTACTPQETISRLVRSLDTIATLPEVVARINRCVNDHRSSAADLQNIIETDPALASRLLKLVNSAFYARSVAIDSIERAIVLLGFEAVQHLAIAASIGRLFKGGKICDRFSAKDLWTHCVAVAAVSRELARRAGANFAEEAFLAGLMHDIGLLVSLQVCRGQLRQVCDRATARTADFAELERQVIGVDHLQLGGALAGRWKFPASVHAIAAHHDNPGALDQRWRPIGAIVYVADIICCQEHIGFDLTAQGLTISEAAVAESVPSSLIQLARENAGTWAAPAIQIFE